MRRRYYLKEKKNLTRKLKDNIREYREYKNLNCKNLCKLIEDEYLRQCVEIEVLNLSYKKEREDKRIRRIK